MKMGKAHSWSHSPNNLLTLKEEINQLHDKFDYNYNINKYKLFRQVCRFAHSTCKDIVKVQIIRANYGRIIALTLVA
mgnify:CR=1 FL=1